SPSSVQAALALLVRLGRIEIIPLIRQIMLLEVSFHCRVSEVKYRADLECAEVRIVRNNSQISALGVLDFAQSRNPNRGSQFAHAALKRFEFHQGAELLESSFVFRRRDGSVKCFVSRGGNAWRVGLKVQFEELLELFG